MWQDVTVKQTTDDYLLDCLTEMIKKLEAAKNGHTKGTQLPYVLKDLAEATAVGLACLQKHGIGFVPLDNEGAT